jgi:hypothetical protein
MPVNLTFSTRQLVRILGIETEQTGIEHFMRASVLYKIKFDH